ncbi:MAG: ATP-binding protein [Legionellales bacterium]|jgi:hypothetical protein
MSTFIGRKQELETLGSLLKKKSASLIVIKGRRRIGKSRLIEEFARLHAFDHVFIFSGLFPTRKTTLQSQLDEFSNQLHTQTGLPEIKVDDWNKLFLLLAEKLKFGKTLVLLDEISWMGSKDPDFLGKFKNAWDLYFKKNDQLIVVLCGSVSTWIEKNILSSTGFVGRISIDLTLKELPLHDCAKFWGKQITHVSAYEKFKILCVTGGIPLYLEHLNPHLSAEENVKQLCFSPYGILFDEFEKIFSDLFSKRSVKYKKIVECLSNKPATQEEICNAIQIKHSSDIHEYLDDLAQSGFVTKAHTWRIKEALPSNLRQYRLSDNYSRFYLKYIYPNRIKIENNQFTQTAIARLPNWDIIMGLQFENLVLNNRLALWKLLKIQPEEIICDNPYFQRKTERIKGCQIDYLIQTKYNTLYVCEIKFSKNILGRDIVNEVSNKISAITIPKHFSYRPVLIHVNGVSDEVIESDFFSTIIDFGQLLLDT